MRGSVNSVRMPRNFRITSSKSHSRKGAHALEGAPFPHAPVVRDPRVLVSRLRSGDADPSDELLDGVRVLA